MPIKDGDLLLVNRDGTDYKYDATQFKGDPGDEGIGIPTGGDTGEVLVKSSGTDYDAEWQPQVDAKTYLIETDYLVSPQIQLVDSDGNFSNVHFKAEGDLTVSSDPDGITYSISTGDYATKLFVEEGDQSTFDQLTTDYQAADDALSALIDDNARDIEQLTVTKGAASQYTVADIGAQIAIRPGDMYVGQTQVSSITFISLAPEDKNGLARPLAAVGDTIELVKANNTAYRFEITTETDGTFSVVHVGGTGTDLIMAGMVRYLSILRTRPLPLLTC